MSCSVSIHAPTRGATDENAVIGKKTGVSIHAPTRGATSCMFIQVNYFGFQSTHPHGVRPCSRIPVLCIGCFNPRTHTGCDDYLKAICKWAIKFQSTHPHGVRPPLYFSIIQAVVFQSTHPHGVRLRGIILIYPSGCFNPRTHTGCDCLEDYGANVIDRFQSTHPHGVRHRYILKDAGWDKFQSTHPHGVRRSYAPFTNSNLLVSIHAPTRGATYGKLSDVLTAIKFQSTHPHGVRPISFIRMLRKHGCFNPRTHTGCDLLHRQDDG